jgi:hypothetical protein
MKALAFVFMLPGLTALLLGVMLLGAVNSAYPLAVLWQWFAVPLGAPSISVPVAMGMLFIYSIFRSVRATPSNRETQEKVGDAIGMFLLPWLALLCGWIVKAVWL